ncbi:MAG: metal-dependent hydrolase [Chloroflexota bacterium]|nr:metal-dependent hydrolase [Chloroflexota bacterium]
MADGARFSWYGHACVELTTPGGKVVLFDPWFGNPTSPRPADDVETCDVMLVSHGHHDHLGAFPMQIDSADALTIARRTGPVWPCIHEMSLWLEEMAGQGPEVIGFNKGGTVDARGLRVTMVTAQHSAGDWVAGARTGGSVYLGEPAGFVVELEDGRRVYFAGDTEVFGDMSLVRDMHAPDVAFLPIGGHYTMGPRGAARSAQLLGVRAVVPIHYGTFPVLAGTPDELRRELDALGAEVEVVAPERGSETSLP